MKKIPIQKNKEYIVNIIDNGFEGEGIAKIEDYTIFIQGALKGEKIKILIVKVKASYAFGKIIEIIEKYNPDIIHIHNIHGFYANYELLFDFLADKKIPIIITLHDCWLYTGFCAYYDFINCKEWESNCNSCKARFCYPYRL